MEATIIPPNDFSTQHPDLWERFIQYQLDVLQNHQDECDVQYNDSINEILSCTPQEIVNRLRKDDTDQICTFKIYNNVVWINIYADRGRFNEPVLVKDTTTGEIYDAQDPDVELPEEIADVIFEL